MEKIFEQIKFEIQKQEFKYGKNNYHSAGGTISETDRISKLMSVKVNYRNNDDPSWLRVFCDPFDSLLNSGGDYERRTELIKCVAVMMNWIDCIDRNNTATIPELEFKGFNDETFMPFGKYKGHKLKMIPSAYLLEALENNFVDGLLKDYIIENKKLLLQVIDTGYDCINSKITDL